MRKSYLVLLCTLTLLAVGCGKKISSESSKYAVIDLEKGLKQRSTARITSLNDIGSVENIISIETNDSTILGYTRIAGADEKSIGVYDNYSFFIVNKEDGKVSSRIQRIGKGPGEYLKISTARVLDDNLIAIVSLQEGRLNLYEKDGKFFRSFQNDTVAYVARLENGDIVMTNKNHRSNESIFNISILDSQWSPKRSGLKRSNEVDYEMLLLPSTFRLNGQTYFREIYGDTIYHINSELDEPFLIINKGRYRMPEEYRSSVEKSQSEGPKYINGEYAYIASDFLFITYDYNKEHYFDVWSIETAKLLYRNVVNGPGIPEGMPLTVEGKTIYLWPTYVDEEYLYFRLDGKNLEELRPDLADDNNESFIELKLKSLLQKNS